MIRQRMLVMGAALALLTGACATTQDTPARFTTITLEKPVHFSAPDGGDVMAVPGRYHVDSIEEATLRLTPAEAATGTSLLIVAAMTLPHEEPIESRVALSVPNGEDEHHVVLLMPDGKGLDAGGTYSGLRSRGGGIASLSMVQVQAALFQQGPVVRDHRTPRDFDLAYAYAPIHYQDTDSTNYRADYVARFDYDGNLNATDNWENLTKFPLAAHAYYSVVETCTHRFITYGFFHPRDWTDSTADQEHENDMEGLLTIARKDGTPYGRLEGMITVFHSDFFSGSSRITVGPFPHSESTTAGTRRRF